MPHAPQPGPPTTPPVDDLLAAALSAVAAFLDEEGTARGSPLPSRWRQALRRDFVQENPWRSLAWARPGHWKGAR
ncbi:MAG: hypothetical protein HY686_08885 [Chloroflexi bacterium]|nr:hypothetical protein [Chloroflexota bacterium]